MKYRSSGPKIGPGRRIVASGNISNTACSPSHLLRRYSDGADWEAPNADTWMNRSTPASLASYITNQHIHLRQGKETNCRQEWVS